jgi:hypothetical protein
MSLRGMMLGITVAAICLAFAVQGGSQTTAMAFCAFSAVLTIVCLVWLCGPWRGAQRDDAEQ